jgi:ribosome-associated protein
MILPARRACVPCPAGLMRDDGPMRDISTSGSGPDPIRLGQFLKLADAVELGSDVKLLLAEGSVLVNGEVETRRGRQLAPGDVVEVRGERFRLR